MTNITDWSKQILPTKLDKYSVRSDCTNPMIIFHKYTDQIAQILQADCTNIPIKSTQIRAVIKGRRILASFSVSPNKEQRRPITTCSRRNGAAAAGAGVPGFVGVCRWYRRDLPDRVRLLYQLSPGEEGGEGAGAGGGGGGGGGGE